MKRLIALVLVAGGLFTLSLVGQAQATHSLPHLLRQVNRLEDQVRSLQSRLNAAEREIRAVSNDVFNCTFYDDVPVSFTDGTIGYALYYDSVCAVSARARNASR